MISRAATRRSGLNRATPWTVGQPGGHGGVVAGHICHWPGHAHAQFRQLLQSATLGPGLPLSESRAWVETAERGVLGSGLVREMVLCWTQRSQRPARVATVTGHLEGPHRALMAEQGDQSPEAGNPQLPRLPQVPQYWQADRIAAEDQCHHDAIDPQALASPDLLAPGRRVVVASKSTKGLRPLQRIKVSVTSKMGAPMGSRALTMGFATSSTSESVAHAALENKRRAWLGVAIAGRLRCRKASRGRCAPGGGRGNQRLEHRR